MVWKWLKKKALKKAEEMEKEEEEIMDVKELRKDDKEFQSEKEQLKKLLKHKRRLK